MVRMFVPDFTWLLIAQCFQLILLGLVAVRLREIRVDQPRRHDKSRTQRTVTHLSVTVRRTCGTHRTSAPSQFRKQSRCHKHQLLSAISGCSGVWVPPPKYRNKEACKQRKYHEADLYPVPDRR